VSRRPRRARLLIGRCTKGRKNPATASPLREEEEAKETLERIYDAIYTLFAALLKASDKRALSKQLHAVLHCERLADDIW
jgi:hypothetical protein